MRVSPEMLAHIDSRHVKTPRFLRNKLGKPFTAGVVLYAGANTLELEDRMGPFP